MAYDPSLFEARRRGYQQNYAAEGAMNAYKNFLSQQRGQRNIVDLQKSYQKAAPQVVAGYGRRNLISPNTRSGVFNRGFRDFATESVRQQADAERALREGMYGYDLSSRSAQSNYNQQLLDLEADKARQSEENARQILAMRAGVI
jgi:hypothetical protein